LYSAAGYIAAAVFVDLLNRTKEPVTTDAFIKTAQNTKDHTFGDLTLHFVPSSGSMLNTIWFDKGKPENWKQIDIKP